MTLELDFPDREVPARGGFPATPRRLRRWLQALDSNDRRALAQHCHDATHALNRYRLKPRARLEMMERLRPYARTALDYLGGRIHSQSLPLAEPARRIFDLHQDLLQELALGYEAVVAAEAPRRSRRRAARAAQRALALHGERMMRAAQMYAPPSDADWHRVNAVYALAEDARVARRRVDDDQLTAAPQGRQSPQAAFKRLALFALAGTHGLRRREVERVYRALESWAIDARMVVEGPTAIEQARFAVDLERAMAPRRREQIDAGPGSRVRALDVDALVERVERLRAERAPSDAPREDELGPAALGHLAACWRPAVHTRSERVQRGEEVDAAIGLEAIHARIAAELGPPEDQAGGDEAPDPVSPARALSLQTIEGPGRVPRGSQAGAGAAWHEVGRGREPSAGDRHARGAGAERAGATPAQSRWLLEDVSATGYRLRRDGEGPSRAAVGELAALRLAPEGAGGHRWSIGVIRRMQFVDERRFDIGVHALSRNAVVARVRREPSNPNRKRDRRKEPSERALVLPGQRSRGVPATLLVPAHMFRSGEVLELDLRDRRQRARLGPMREHTGAFSQYELGPAPPRGRASTPGQRSPQSPSGA